MSDGQSPLGGAVVLPPERVENPHTVTDHDKNAVDQSQACPATGYHGISFRSDVDGMDMRGQTKSKYQTHETMFVARMVIPPQHKSIHSQVHAALYCFMVFHGLAKKSYIYICAVFCQVERAMDASQQDASQQDVRRGLPRVQSKFC